MNAEDDPAIRDSLGHYRPFFEFIFIGGIRDALEQFVAPRAYQATVAPVDIILLDVNMVQDKFKEDWNWGSSANIAPYGPLLALPYLNATSHTQFAPYSGFWHLPEVNENGYVLLCLGFIYSALKRRPVQLEAIHRLLARTESVKLPEEPLSNALVRLRKSLKSAAIQKQIEFLNINETMLYLKELSSIPINQPISTAPQERGRSLSISWVERDGNVEQIVLRSLFADKCGFSESPIDWDIRSILEELKSWPFTDKHIWDDEGLRQSAMDILTDCALDQSSNNILHDLVDKHTFVTTARGPKYLLLRMVILFAWVAAWYLRVFRGREDTWDTVRSYFYHGGKNTTFDQRYKTYLGEKRERVSYEVFRSPFRAFSPDDDEFPRQSYMLTTDEPGFLHEKDRELCKSFAQDGLETFLTAVGETDASPWIERPARMYPRWMKESEFWKMSVGAQYKPRSRQMR